MIGNIKNGFSLKKKIISLRTSVGDLRPMDILTGKRAVEVTGVVGANPASWHFRSKSKDCFV
jgi:hypothetical protein